MKCPHCKKEIKYKEPVSVEKHWDCGVCGCSHKYYDDAYDCCFNKGSDDE